jgi:alpha-mannosidase
MRSFRIARFIRNGGSSLPYPRGDRVAQLRRCAVRRILRGIVNTQETSAAATDAPSLYFVVHTHWDREWYQPFQTMRARLVKMADRMIPMIESGALPSFHFDGQTIVLEDYLAVRPAMRPRLRKLIASNKIQIGPWYVLADSFLVSGESLIRNLEIGRADARKFGRALNIGYLPDQFGHIAQMPQILAGFGMDTAVLWRGVGADVTRHRFRWEALDGTPVTTIYLPSGYWNGANLPLESLDRFVERASKIAQAEMSFAQGGPILVMNGTDHTEPDPRLYARVNEAREVSAMTLEIGTLEGFAALIRERGAPVVDSHRGELRSALRAYLLPGVTSARTWIKQRDFENCATLEKYSDPMAAMAAELSRGAGLEQFLDLAWRTELKNHPHDSICGCSVDQVHADMRYRFDQVAAIAESVVRSAAEAILGTQAGSTRLAVLNPTFSRQALVRAEIELPDNSADWEIEADDGSRIPIAIEHRRSADATVVPVEFVAHNLEQAGFSFFNLVRATARKESESQGAASIENEFYRIAPSARGLSITDLRRGRAMELYFEDDGDRGDEYNFDAVGDGDAISHPAALSTCVEAAGAVRKRVIQQIRFDIPESLTPGRGARATATVALEIELTATLYAGLDRVDFSARVMNPARDHRLRAALSIPVVSPESIHDTSFGVVRRSGHPTEAGGTEEFCPTSPHRTFTAVESSELSVAMMSRGLYEAEVRANTPGSSTILLTMIRCVGWLSRSDLRMRPGGAGPQLEAPGAQEIGEHRFEFAMTTYRGSYRDATLIETAQAYAYPPRAFFASHSDTAARFLIRCDNPLVAFSTARARERGNAYRVRAFSMSDCPEEVRFAFGPNRRARIVRLDGAAVPRRAMRRTREGSIAMNLRPFEIVTFKVAAASRRAAKKYFRESGKRD